jgi:hypothetical protein
VNLSGNHTWKFQVTPDFALAPMGTPLAVELAFAVDHSDLLGVTVNAPIWDTALLGNNPFTGTMTSGLWLDLIGDRTFGAFGSIDIMTSGPVDLFYVETAGAGFTTLRYGVAASGHPSHGARISQITGPFTAENFDGYTGAVSIPEPTFAGISVIGTVLWGAFARRHRSAQKVAGGICRV